MERTDKLTKITMALLFVALLAYVGAYLARSVSEKAQTAPAMLITIDDGITISGIVIRDEQVIESGDEHVSVTAEQGKMLPVGAPIAVSMENESALERINRIRELELEIEHVQTLLKGIDTAMDLSLRDSAIRNAVIAVSWATATHNLSEVESSGMQLKSLLFESGSPTVSEADLAALEFELAGLKSSREVGTAEILSESAGLFSTILDGYEHIGPGDVQRLSPSGFEELLDGRREVPDTAIGKLICSYTWYFAAVIAEESAENLAEGASIKLDFGRYFKSAITARVVSVGRPENGECVVVFAISEALADTLAMRQVTAQVIFNEYTGIRIPSRALRLDEKGQTYVYTITAMQAEKKLVDIIYMADDYCIAEVEARADALRAGNEIVVSASDIYEGKQMG